MTKIMNSKFIVPKFKDCLDRINRIVEKNPSWTEDQKIFYQILCRYDHLHAPPNWDPQYKHELTIEDWHNWFYDIDNLSKLKHLIAKIIREWNKLDLEEEKINSCSQWGTISEWLYSPMIDYFT